MIDDPMSFNERLKDLKEQRPPCPASKNGKHTWVEYASDNVKVCVDCKYRENILIPYDD